MGRRRIVRGPVESGYALAGRAVFLERTATTCTKKVYSLQGELVDVIHDLRCSPFKSCLVDAELHLKCLKLAWQ